MAELINTSTQKHIYINKYHVMGRYKDMVNTFIQQPKISRIHMVIEWFNNSWYIKDISKNGVWINNKKLNTEQHYRLGLNDTIALAGYSNILFLVVNLDKPKDVLISFLRKSKTGSRFYMFHLFRPYSFFA